MRRILFIAAAALGAAGLFAVGLGLGATGTTTTTTLSAKLVAARETPRPKGAALATGLFSATLNGRSLTWRLTFSHLTGKALAAHIHLGRAGVAGPVVVPLCGPCVSGVHRKVTVTPKVRTALMNGTAYVNVHTAKNPAGEIRGQVARPGLVGNSAPPVTTTTDTSQTTTGVYGY